MAQVIGRADQGKNKRTGSKKNEVPRRVEDARPAKDTDYDSDIPLGADASSFFTSKTYDACSGNEWTSDAFDRGMYSEDSWKKTRNKKKWRPLETKTENNSFWESNERTKQPIPSWEYPDISQSEYANSNVRASSQSRGNVWEERKKKAEEMKAMEPTNETEEEAMIRQALELSKLEAMQEEEKRKRFAKEYQMQLYMLESSPELVEEFKVVEKSLPSNETVHKNSAVQSKHVASNTATVKQESIAVDQDSVWGSNEDQESISYGGAKPKFGKIIDCFGGWGLKENISKSSKMNVNESNDHWNESNVKDYSNMKRETEFPAKQEESSVHISSHSSGKNRFSKDISLKRSCETSSSVKPNDKFSNISKTGNNDFVKNDNIPPSKTNACWDDCSIKDYGSYGNVEYPGKLKETLPDPVSHFSGQARDSEDIPLSDYCDASSSDINTVKNIPKADKNQFVENVNIFNSVPNQSSDEVNSCDWNDSGGNNSAHSKNRNHAKKELSYVSGKKEVVQFDDFIEILKKDSVEGITETLSGNLYSKEIYQKSAEDFEDNDTENRGNIMHIGSADIKRDNIAVSNTRNAAIKDYNFDFINTEIEAPSKKLSNDYNFELSDSSNANFNVNRTCSVSNTFNDSNDHPRHSASSNVTNANFDFAPHERERNISYNSHTSGDVCESSETFNNITDQPVPVLSSTMLPEPSSYVSNHNQEMHSSFHESASNFRACENNDETVENNPNFNPLLQPYLIPNHLNFGVPLMPNLPLGIAPLNPAFMPYGNINPMIMQQMLMFSNPFFVKQLQALDLHYRSMGVPANYSLLQMQNPNIDVSSLGQNPNILASEMQKMSLHLENPPNDCSPNYENPELVGRISKPRSAPPGLNDDFMPSDKSLDAFNEADINPFLKSCCSDSLAVDEPTIPPPKPPQSKCNVPISESHSNVYTHASNPSALHVSEDYVQLSNMHKDVVHNNALANQSRPSELHRNTESHKPTNDVVSSNLNPAFQYSDSECIGWGDPEEDHSMPQKFERKTLWNDSVDGWGNDVSPSPAQPVRNSSNIDGKRRPVPRQPASQPYVGRFAQKN